MSELFAPILAAGPVREATGDAGWLRAMLEAEAALAEAQADVGVLDRADAEAIARACREGGFEAERIGAESTRVGNPAAPLVHAVRERLPERIAASVHSGATSQDIVDTGAMLVAARSCDAVLTDLDGCAADLARLAERHSATLQIGRTLLRQAVPTTFGLTAATWLSGVDSAAAALSRTRENLAAQLGGPAGTLAAFGRQGPAVLAAYCARLGLAEPELPWHTERSRVAALASALGRTCGSVAGIARTVTLLAQDEVGEVSEQGPPGSGGSSSMPHKRNPIAAVSALACARQAPGLVATLLAAMEQEHQRAAGAWHAEWRPLTELLRATGSAAYWLRECLRRLAIHPDRMLANCPGASRDVGSAEEFVRRALLAHRDHIARTQRKGRAPA